MTFLLSHEKGCCRWKAFPSPNKCFLPWQRSFPLQLPSPFCHPEHATCLRQVKRGMNWETSGPFGTRVPSPLATALSLSTTLSYLSFRPGFPATLRRTRLRVRLSLKERRMKFISATNLNRKSGGAKPNFLLHRSRQRPRMWFSSKRTTCS